MGNYMMRNNPASVQRGGAPNCQQPAAEKYQPQMAAGRCPCTRGTSFETMNQMQLLNYINEVSFAVDDILLYLDTHPCDSGALAYSREMTAARKESMAVYARRFGPLTIDCTNETESCRWEWVMQPWPWEPVGKGGCR